MSGGKRPVAGERAVFWRDHVGAWRGSGLSARDYCQRHGLNRGTLGYWASRLRRAAAFAAPGFLPVEVEMAAAPVAPAAAGIVVEGAAGLRVHVARDFDADTLARVLAVVR